ncbi:MAG: hypothetical protein PW735_04560 [Acidobacteriaceae bacterium]|nr:hypothetical protein [Acidobacteriaceae bacterium]
MHHLLVAFFAFLFSFGHAHPAASIMPKDAFIPPAQYAQGLEGAVPSRHELLDQHELLNGAYAGAGCPGCRTMTVSSATRLN